MAAYGITMNPGEDSTVGNFSKNMIGTFPYAGTNYFTGASSRATG